MAGSRNCVGEKDSLASILISSPEGRNELKYISTEYLESLIALLEFF